MGAGARLLPYLVRTKEESLRISDSSPIRSGFDLKVNKTGFLNDKNLN